MDFKLGYISYNFFKYVTYCNACASNDKYMKSTAKVAI